MTGRNRMERQTGFMRNCTVVICVAAVTAAVVLFGYIARRHTYEIDEAVMDGAYEMTLAPHVQEMAKEMARRQEAALNNTVEIQINGMPQADGTSGRCNLMVGNPEGNIQDFRITVSLDENGQIIYRSQVLKPGERVAYAVLDQIPEPGKYSATAEFSVLDPETGAVVGAVDAGLLLTVE